MGVTTQCIIWRKYGSEHNLLPQCGGHPKAEADPDFTKKVKSESDSQVCSQPLPGTFGTLGGRTLMFHLVHFRDTSQSDYTPC